MKTERLVEMTFGIALILIIVIAGFGQAVLQLWNWLMPTIFGLPAISFWQAVGLLGLSWILFGGLRGFGFHDVRMRRHSNRPTLAHDFRGTRSSAEIPWRILWKTSFSRRDGVNASYQRWPQSASTALDSRHPPSGTGKLPCGIGIILLAQFA